MKAKEVQLELPKMVQRLIDKVSWNNNYLVAVNVEEGRFEVGSIKNKLLLCYHDHLMEDMTTKWRNLRFYLNGNEYLITTNSRNVHFYKTDSRGECINPEWDEVQDAFNELVKKHEI